MHGMKEEDLFKAMLSGLPESVYFVDMERRIRYWNRACERVTGFSMSEVLGKCCADNILTHINAEGTCLCGPGCPLFRMHARRSSAERPHLSAPQGGAIGFRWTFPAASIYDESGKLMGAVESFHDISEVMEALSEIEKLKEASLICSLTNIGNRRYTEEMIKQKLAEMRRTESDLSILFFDVDNFKSINDQYGHQAGDNVLKMVSRTLLGGMRSYDFLGRWGGEEFVGILPNLDHQHLRERSETLRVLVEQSYHFMDGVNLRATVSIGAYACQPQDTLESSVAKADALMYQSKKQGRNQVTVG